jgi:hypothetical protein
MQLDVYGQLTLFDRLKIGGSLGVSRTTGGRTEGRAAQITKNNNDKDWNAVSRSHWIGYQVNDAILIRAGRLNLPFGIRMPDHFLWVRTDTRTDRESSQQHGLAVDYSAGRFRGEIMGIAGNYQISPDDFRDRGYSLFGEYLITPTAAVGVSSLVTHAKLDKIDRVPETRQGHGLTGRYSPFRPLVLLAEADMLISDQHNLGYTAMLQADYEIIQGLHGMLTGETHDLGRFSNSPAIIGQGKNQLGGWVSLTWFFFTHFDARFDFYARQNTAPAFLSQVHWYF